MTCVPRAGRCNRLMRCLAVILFALGGCAATPDDPPAPVETTDVHASRPSVPIEQLTLERIGDAEASVGMISLPLPRDLATALSIDHPTVGLQPVGWWERHKTPRRVMAYIVDDAGVPDTLQLARHRVAQADSEAWGVRYNTTFERLPFKNTPVWSYDALRGYPAADCTLVEGEVQLTYAGHTIGLQVGATGPAEGSRGADGVYWWQNVQVDRLWANEAAQAVRVGGIIYNSDTFLWADVYLVLFANGVAQVATHFTNTRLAIAGYDFQGLPVIRITGDLGGAEPTEHVIPADGTRHRVGPIDLNLTDAALLSSDEHPGRLEVHGDEMRWWPFDRTVHFLEKRPDMPPTEWPIGAGRTVNLTLSLSDAAPVIARYRAPAWWYGVCGDLWPGEYLPVDGRVSRGMVKNVRDRMHNIVRGRFNAGRTGSQDGGAGEGAWYAYYRTGDPRLLANAIAACTFWTDLMVDHSDHTIHQEVGWPYKTGAYLKFRDILFAWIETGDPYFLDNAEMTADAQWAWFRSNWPRNTIGRDNFGAGGWALMWKYMDTEQARERVLEYVRMNQRVMEQRGTIGGQMGAGPHPGYHASLYMVGVGMVNLLEAADRFAETGDDDSLETVVAILRRCCEHYQRDDVEYYPSHMGVHRGAWLSQNATGWNINARRIYAGLARLTGHEDPRTRHAMARVHQLRSDPAGSWSGYGRDSTNYWSGYWYDAQLLGAQVAGDELVIEPIGNVAHWPETQVIYTPWGIVRLHTQVDGAQATLRFEAEYDLPVTVRYRGQTARTTTTGACTLRAN